MANMKSIEKGHYHCSACWDMLAGFKIFKSVLASKEKVGMLNKRSHMSYFSYKFLSKPEILDVNRNISWL